MKMYNKKDNITWINSVDLKLILIWTSAQEEYPQTLTSQPKASLPTTNQPKASLPTTNQPATNLPVFNRMLMGKHVDETVDGKFNISNITISEASNSKGKINTKLKKKYFR